MHVVNAMVYQLHTMHSPTTVVIYIYNLGGFGIMCTSPVMTYVQIMAPVKFQVYVMHMY